MKYSVTEREVIFLKAITELIDNMVNYEVLELFHDDPNSSIRFKSMTHQKYFNILLLDFLSCSDEKILGERLSYLNALQTICQSPSFDMNSSIKYLTISVNEFIEWLQKEVVVEKIWLPSIDLETNLLIKRVEFIKICGNISKHNFSRLSGVVRELKGIFKRNEIDLESEDVLLILEEFYDWFHGGILNYHSSAIAEFLNNVRWGIHEYLQPEFKQSIVYENNEEHPWKYHYTYPKEVNNKFTQNCYCELMNEIRLKPYIEKFQVTRYMKMRY